MSRHIHSRWPTTTSLAALALVALAAQACDRSSQAAAPEQSVAQVEDRSSDAQEKKEKQFTTKVTKIVFVGLKDCCQCTGKRIEASWATLQDALAVKSEVEVERIDLDVEETRVAELEKLGKIMVVPGLFFLSADGKVIKLLQGEVSKKQVAELLQ